MNFKLKSEINLEIQKKLQNTRWELIQKKMRKFTLLNKPKSK